MNPSVWDHLFIRLDRWFGGRRSRRHLTEEPFAKHLFEAADRLRGSFESSEYKHLVLLGLLFLKYVSDSFQLRRELLEAKTRQSGTGSTPRTRQSGSGSSKTVTKAHRQPVSVPFNQPQLVLMTSTRS